MGGKFVRKTYCSETFMQMIYEGKELRNFRVTLRKDQMQEYRVRKTKSKKAVYVPARNYQIPLSTWFSGFK